MKYSTQDRKRGKPKVLKRSALSAGIAALAALESSDIAAKPVQITARTLIAEGIEPIMRLRGKGVPLLRIYTEIKKAAGLRISYQTFAGYVSEASKEAGLRPAKTEAAPAARPQSEMTAGEWGCAECESKAARVEKEDGRAW